MLISVLYHGPAEPIDMQSIVDFGQNIARAGTYANSIILSIQKETFEKVAEFLEQEAIS